MGPPDNREQKWVTVFGYILRRVVAAFLVVVVTSMIVFAIFFLGPVNPAAQICNDSGRCTEQRQALLEESLGLNQSVFSAYGDFVKGIFVGRTIEAGGTYECDAPCLGISYSTRQEVRKQMTDKYPATITLAVGGAAVYLLVGVTAGALAARWRGTVADRALVSSSLLVSSIPYYVLALLAWLFLVLQWRVFPVTGYFPITEDPLKTIGGMLLPWLILGLAGSTAYARFSRGFMVESLGADYARTAAAKGLSRNKVVFKHGLRAAIVPVVTIFGLDFAFLLSGTIFTEVIFEIDGIGNYAIRALSPTDFPIISAVVLASAVAVVVANLVVDVAYSFLDPRVRLS